ncbi:hypothetical protein ABFT51_07680 [Paenibacillus peoriae]|uniref:hypothetical protein n=1 Tax=Paenibacillus peoriae TaxID=59893 RepID=UPI0032AF6B97
MNLRLVKNVGKESLPTKTTDFDEVEILISLAEQLLVHHNLSTEDALYIADSLKSELEETLQAEKDGTLEKMFGGKKK